LDQSVIAMTKCNFKTVSQQVDLMQFGHCIDPTKANIMGNTDFGFGSKVKFNVQQHPCLSNLSTCTAEQNKTIESIEG
jgi:hypothetical protein